MKFDITSFRAVDVNLAVEGEVCDLAHAKRSTPTETDPEIAPLIEKIGATSIAEIDRLIAELPTHYRSAQQWRFPEPFVREIEERFGDCLDTDHSAGRGNGMSSIMAGKQPNEAERVHRGERAPRRGLDCRPNVRAEPHRYSTVPNAAPHESKWKILPIPQSPNPNQRRNTRGREQPDSTPVLQELRADLIGSCMPSIKMATTVLKFDDFARARLGPGPLSMELASELRMSKVMQLCAAIAPRGFVLPKHLNLMSSDAGDRARSAGRIIVFTDPGDAVA